MDVTKVTILTLGIITDLAAHIVIIHTHTHLVLCLQLLLRLLFAETWPLGKVTLVGVLVRQNVHPVLQQRVPLVGLEHFGRQEHLLAPPTLAEHLYPLRHTALLNRLHSHLDGTDVLVAILVSSCLLCLRWLHDCEVDVGVSMASVDRWSQGVRDGDLRTVGVVVAKEAHVGLWGHVGVRVLLEVDGVRVQVGTSGKLDVVVYSVRLVR